MARKNMPAPSFADYGTDPDGREEWLRNLAMLVRQLLFGKTNAVGDITLTINVASSTLTDERIGADSHITFMPTTANARTELYGDTMHVSARAKGSATITHANNAETDRDFTYKVDN